MTSYVLVRRAPAPLDDWDVTCNDRSGTRCSYNDSQQGWVHPRPPTFSFHFLGESFWASWHIWICILTMLYFGFRSGHFLRTLPLSCHQCQWAGSNQFSLTDTFLALGTPFKNCVVVDRAPRSVIFLWRSTSFLGRSIHAHSRVATTQRRHRNWCLLC